MTWSPPDSGTLHAILGHAPGFIAYMDADRIIRYMNRASYGFTLEQAIGRDYASFQTPDQASKVLQAMARACESREEQYLEGFMDTSDGDRVWFSSRISALFDESGTLAGYVSIIADITEQKLAQAELARSRKELLEASQRAGMAEVVNNVLHNIGNVLNSVTVATSLFIEELEHSRLPLLERTAAMLAERRHDLTEFLTQDEKGRLLPEFLGRLSTELAAERTRLLKRAGEQQEHIELIRATIDAQQDLARRSEVVEAVNLAELMDRLVAMFLIDIERHKIALEVDVPAHVVTIDKYSVMQIVANLIRNGIDALESRPADGQTPRRLRIEVAIDARDITLSVSDNGCGIRDVDLARLFEHGFTTKPDGHGFGLHASIASARRINGTLGAESPGPGQGATFRLTIPCSNPEPG